MSMALSTSPATKHPGKLEDRTFTISVNKKKQLSSNSPRRKHQSQPTTQTTQQSHQNNQQNGNPSVLVQHNQIATSRGPMRRRNSNDNLIYRKGNEGKPFKYRKQEEYENSRDPPSPTQSVSSSSGYNANNNSSMTSNNSGRVNHSPETRSLNKYSSQDLHSVRYQMRKNNEGSRNPQQLTARLIPNKVYSKHEIENLRIAMSDTVNVKKYYNVTPYSSYSNYHGPNYVYQNNRFTNNGIQQQRNFPRPGYFIHGQSPQYQRNEDRYCHCTIPGSQMIYNHMYHRFCCYNCRCPLRIVSYQDDNNNNVKNKAELYQRYASNGTVNNKQVLVTKQKWQENRKPDENIQKDERRNDRPVNRINNNNLVYVSSANYNRPPSSSVSPTPTNSSKSSSPPLEPIDTSTRRFKQLDVNFRRTDQELKPILTSQQLSHPPPSINQNHQIHHMAPMKPTLNIPPPNVTAPNPEDMINFRVPPPNTHQNVNLWVSNLTPPVGPFDQQHQASYQGYEDQNFLKRRPPALPAGRVSPNVYPTVIPVSPVHYQQTQVLQPPHRKPGYFHSEVVYFTPYDRFLSRSHLMETREQPEMLLNNSRWDRLSKSIWDKFVDNQQTVETYRNKLSMWKHLFVLVKNTYPKCGLYMVGSTISGFGADSSDVDMCLVSKESQVEQREEALITLNDLKGYIINVSNFQQFVLIQAKVPILRFRDQTNKYEVDLNFNNCVGIRNTHLLSCYSQMDWRLKPLALVVKLWAQHHNINDARNMTISSYSLVLMVIHFLQYAVVPAILPCLHQEFPKTFNANQDIGCIDMMEDMKPWYNTNQQTIGELFCQFLDYFSKFEYSTHAMSIRVGGLLPIDHCRNAKSPKNDPNHWRTLCIEEPFDLTNTARSTHDTVVFDQIKKVFQMSSKTINESHELNDLFSEQFFKPSLSPALSFSSLVGKYGESLK